MIDKPAGHAGKAPSVQCGAQEARAAFVALLVGSWYAYQQYERAQECALR